MKSYNIFHNGCVVGTVDFEPVGLYVRIKAVCYPPETRIYRLILLCGFKSMDLGICVPEGDGFQVNKRILLKEIEGESLQFIIEEKDKSTHVRFIPLDTEKPLNCLDSLLKCRYVIRDSSCGLEIESSD